MKIFVFGDQYAVVFSSQLPDRWVRRPANAEQPDVLHQLF